MRNVICNQPDPAAERAREAEAAWTTLAELSSDMLALLDAQGRIVWVNQAFVQTGGWPASQSVGKSFADFIGYRETSDAWRRVDSALAASTPIEPIELPWRHPSGNKRWGRLTAKRLPAILERTAQLAVSLQDLSEQHRLADLLEASQGVATPNGRMQRLHSQSEVKNSPAGALERTAGIMVDDTETYELAQAFNETSEQLRLAVGLGNIAIWRHDLRTNRVHYNYRAYQVLDIAPRPEGLSLEEIWPLIHPDDLPRVVAAASTALQSEQPVDMEARYRRADGSWRHVLTRRVLRRDVAGEPFEFVGVALDITDRVHTEAALRSANERVALTARSVGLGTWEWEPRSDTSAWDEQMYRLRGLEPRSVPPNARLRRETVHPDDRDRVDGLLDDAVRNRWSAAYEFRVVWPDGSVHWLASRSTPVESTDGTHYIGVNWDITENVNAETAQREKFIAQRESEAKSQFLARMSHELRTPMNAVMGFAQLLQNDIGEHATEQRTRIEHILSAGEHLLSLINDVLDLSSLESGQLKLDIQAVPLQELVGEALPLVTPLANSFHVKLESGPIEGMAWGDRIRLRQVLINLLSNAIKYNRPSGFARISAQMDSAHVYISVADSGRGLSADQRSHLFEPFNRLGIESEGIEGTGIGLAIVKTLVTRMGGTLEVKSEPNKGSTFLVKLRRADIPMALASKDPQPDPSTMEGITSARLLYIEDNPINVMLMVELVESREGWAVVSENNGARGVARAITMKPDIVLVDMQLPDFDGFEVLRRLRCAPAIVDVPCIAVSANAMPDDIAKALAAGFDEYWTKPINFDAFLKSLEMRLASRSFTSP